MSYFLCLSIPVPVNYIRDFFDSRVEFEEISAAPVGRATMGNRSGGKAYLLSARGGSEALLDKGYWQYSCSAEFKAGVSALLTKLPSISFMVNWLGDPTSQGVVAAGRRTLALDAFMELFPAKVDEGIRYIVLAPQTPPQKDEFPVGSSPRP